MGFIRLQKTYAPIILARRCKKMKIQIKNNQLHTEDDESNKSWSRVIGTALIQPCKLLGIQVIIQVLAIYVGYIYGLLYIMLSTFTTVWTNTYQESTDTAGLNYISMGLGFLLGTQICAPISDYVSQITSPSSCHAAKSQFYNRLKVRNKNVGLPEFRSFLLLPTALLIPLGFLWYGWSAAHRLHWIMPNIGVCFASAGIIIGMQTVTAYIVDAYGIYSASAVASVTVLRSLAGFG